MMKVILTVIAALSVMLPTDLTYAKIGDGAVLFDCVDSSYVEIAALPETYYVALLHENDDGYFLVSYMDVVGYVKSGDVDKVDYTPKTKYADRAFYVDNDSQPANLRRSPKKEDGNIVAVMPSGSGGKVIGTIAGDELISGAGNDWYYVRFENGGEITFGYVYAAHVSASGADANDGEKEAENEQEIATEKEPSVFVPSAPLRIVLICALCLPVVVCAFMLRKKRTDESDKQEQNS